ncbi:hypothetical protein U1Q18_020560 [Sarracenia purpurea var. burkii]
MSSTLRLFYYAVVPQWQSVDGPTLSGADSPLRQWRSLAIAIDGDGAVADLGSRRRGVPQRSGACTTAQSRTTTRTPEKRCFGPYQTVRMEKRAPTPPPKMSSPLSEDLVPANRLFGSVQGPRRSGGSARREGCAAR